MVKGYAFAAGGGASSCISEISLTDIRELSNDLVLNAPFVRLTFLRKLLIEVFGSGAPFLTDLSKRRPVDPYALVQPGMFVDDTLHVEPHSAIVFDGDALGLFDEFV